jgi:hypothetical protein
MGLIGLPGDPGVSGAMGTRGATGPKGDQGATGPKGDTGAQGSMGSPGASVALASEPVASSNCAAGGTRLSVGASVEYACNGLPGTKGDKGDQGLKGDKGDKGDTGQPGAFQLLGADGVTLGILAPTGLPGGGGWAVRSPSGAFIQYDAQTGKVGPLDGGAWNTLYFASADCTGTPLTLASTINVGLINNSMLYMATAPYLANITTGSSQGPNTGVCAPGPKLSSYLTATLVGAAPPDAVLPLKIQ